MALSPVASACRFCSSHSELKSAALAVCQAPQVVLIKTPSFSLTPAPRPAGLLGDDLKPGEVPGHRVLYLLASNSRAKVKSIRRAQSQLSIAESDSRQLVFPVR
jgi:hypothetical protein